jgi:predicted dinucleotide-binding enzyme
MKVGILGSGDVGKTLGAGFASLGHEVKIGSREPGKLKDWVEKTGPKASAGTFAEAATFGEMLVLATLWSGTEHAISLAEPKNFSGKVVIDATNPLAFDQPGGPRLALGHTDSGGEQVQRWLPAARGAPAACGGESAMSATPFEQLANLDRRVHEPTRLAILAALSACERADFLFLQRITGLTKGNLSSHLSKLEEGGLVEIEKRFVDKKTQTLVRLSSTGREAIDNYWKEMETLRKSAAGWQPNAVLVPG